MRVLGFRVQGSMYLEGASRLLLYYGYYFGNNNMSSVLGVTSRYK